ncbi:MAG: PH domain-containing protein [Saprospiraceae bacterium]|uniref:PH domain-containing protein n=1 Tax=Candidatus Opimibacter skivensis TaxID=2982028 RepID=A0A9D7SX45_9BACT|nr:PH domain-containing protein [Candidatus Opimibacter skivensis]
MEGPANMHQPQRQSPKAVFLILLKYGRIIISTIWPILLVVLINPASHKGIIITIIVFGVAFLSLVYSILSYLKFYFFIQDDELCVRSGVIRKKILNVPFDRIQSIDFRQNLIHQFLNVVSVRVDTAGSKGIELELDAVDRHRAEELREIVLAYKRTKSNSTNVNSELLSDTSDESLAPELILTLSPKDLIKIGMSENHLRTAGIVFAFFLSIADDINQVLGWDVYGKLEDTTSSISLLGIFATIIAIPLFIGISFLITLVRTVLRYYGLKFWRVGQNFKVVSGLIIRNEKTIQKSKIQLIRWMTSPLKQIFGIYQLNIYQATNMEHQKDKSLVIPGCYQQQVDGTLDMTVPDFRKAVFSTHKMDISIVIRMVFLFGFIPALVFGIMAWRNEGFMQWFLTLIFPIAIIMGYAYQKKRRLKIHPDYILSEAGIFGRSYKLVEIHKIQTVQIHSSPVQRMRGLSSLHIFTAGGDISFPYLKDEIARQARNYIMYRVERDKASWM